MLKHAACLPQRYAMFIATYCYMNDLHKGAIFSADWYICHGPLCLIETHPLAWSEAAWRFSVLAWWRSSSCFKTPKQTYTHTTSTQKIECSVWTWKHHCFFPPLFKKYNHVLSVCVFCQTSAVFTEARRCHHWQKLASSWVKSSGRITNPLIYTTWMFAVSLLTFGSWAHRIPFSRCECSHWMRVRWVSGPSRLRQSGALRRKYRRTSVVAGCITHKLSTEQVAWDRKSGAQAK